MTILFIGEKFKPDTWLSELKKIDPHLDIRVWPNAGNIEDITFALVWRYKHGELKKFPNLKCIASLGAGVEHIMRDPALPRNTPIVRVVDKLLTRDMTQYVVMAVLNYTRLTDRYKIQQQQKQWLPHSPKNEITIGIMGLGQLGRDSAEKLNQLGFKVIGWSRTEKHLQNIKTYTGNSELPIFLRQSEVLINLLPLTPETQHLLNKKLFAELPRGAYLINVARGQHLVDDDLLLALNTEQLSGACLDVFNEEPLPSSHPFWSHPKIYLTPHIASVTNPRSVAAQIVENYHRLQQGLTLLNEVDLQRGY